MAQKRIAILAEMFFYFDMVQFQSGGGENYLLSLIELFKKNDIIVDVYQFSYETKVVKYKKHKITGLGNVKQGMDYELCTDNGVKMFQELTQDADMYIYLTQNLCANKSPKPSIAINHGIYWNFCAPTYKQPEWNNKVKRWNRNVDKVVCVDTDFVNFTRANFPEQIDKMFYTPNFVDTDKFIAQPKVDKSKFTVLYPRRLNELRGLGLATESASILTEKYDDIEFIFCGNGLNGVNEQMAQWAKDHKNCVYMNKDLSEMAPVYNLSDIVLVPSIASEGLSLSMLEGMSSGKGCIGSDVGGIPNALINNFNGLMIRANEQQELTDAIEYAYLHRDEVVQWGENAKNVAKTFDKKRWDKSWLNHIESLIGNPNE